MIFISFFAFTDADGDAIDVRNECGFAIMNRIYDIRDIFVIIKEWPCSIQ